MDQPQPTKKRRDLDQRIDSLAMSMDVVSDSLGRTVFRKRAEKLQPELLSALKAQLSTTKGRQNRKAVNVNVRDEIDRLADSYSSPFRLDNSILKIARKAFIQGAREGFRLGRMPYEELLTLGQKNAAKLGKAPKKGNNIVS